ncbi:MAG TPA: homoserine O-acetyltransferase [Sphingobacteriaceae bacterium]|nr:homoserine O-acetyltransferase [Sphingobacteriaceae bacterium]
MNKEPSKLSIMKSNTYHHTKTFKLESGKRIRNLQIAYHTYGRLNKQKDNVIWVCHALTANSDVFDWWPGLFGPDELFNPREHFIVCANILGSPYGTTNPISTSPATGQPYYLSFPQMSIRDMVAAHGLLAGHLGIDRISVLIGGSLGGQQALEWAITDPKRIDRLVLVATNAVHSPWGIAFNESQRLAISTDRTFYANHPRGGAKGLKTARSIALLSYRTYNTYGATQLETQSERKDDFKASSYQNYQGEKLVKRFNAYSYWFLTKAMDSHNVGRGRGSLEATLRSVKARTLVIGVSSDLLFPVEEQKFMANHIPEAEYLEIDSFYGHDGFLIETKALTKVVKNFLNKRKLPASGIQRQELQSVVY